MNNPEFSDLTCHMRSQIEEQFQLQIRIKVLTIYRLYMTKLKKRQDKGLILTVMDVHSDKHMLLQGVGTSEVI